MKIAIALLTYNRFDMLRRTVESMRDAGYPYSLYVLDGGSSDPVQLDYVRDLGGRCESIPTVGESMNIAIEQALKSNPDVVLFTADDYEYKPGWLVKLVRFWQTAPEDIAITSCNIEPAYPWNGVVGVEGDALIRESTPGSNWSFRASMWDEIGPLPHQTGGEDVIVCQKLKNNGYRLAALDLSIHIGERESAWGNQSWKQAKPLIWP